MEFTGERLVPKKLKVTDETYQEHMERYKFAAGLVGGMVVLDAACGAGYGTRMLSEKAASVIGIDISDEAIQYARQNYSASNLKFEAKDLRQIIFPDASFDAVVSFETIEHIENPELFLDEIRRVLKPGGLLILSTPNVETSCEGAAVHVPFHVKEFTLSEMMTLLNDFTDFSVYAQKMTYHRRLYKKVRLLSRYVPEWIRETILRRWAHKILTPHKIPVLLRIFIYEYAYKAALIPCVEKNAAIKPTFFVIKCCLKGAEIC